MARKPRIFVEDTPIHIYLKSLNNLLLFNDASDYETFLFILEELNTSHDVAIHAFVLEPEFCEFLLTPKLAESTSRFLQSLGRKYVAYYNKKYTHSGTIFEGRFKASLVESANYLLHVMKHIEKKSSNAHKYSSLNENLDLQNTKIVTKHTLYQNRDFYKEFYNQDTDNKVSLFIETALQTQTITGSTDYIKELEREIGKALLSNKRGRPTKKTQQQRKEMYKDLVILDKQAHATLKVNPLENLLFSKNTTHIPVTLKEVPTLSKIFPIVFSMDKEPSLTALIGLDGENLAITLEGKWIDSYIPAHIGKYPFTLASTDTDAEQKIVMIDTAASVVSKSKGKQLFKKSGEKSELLEKAITQLIEHEENINEMKKIAKEIQERGILEKADITVGADDEKRLLVGGFQVVVPAKVNQLSPQTLIDWKDRGILQLIDLHLHSLKNIEVLFNIAKQRQS